MTEQTTIPQLPPVLTVKPSALLWLNQDGVDGRAPVASIAGFLTFENIAAAEAASVSTAIAAIDVQGYYSAGDGGGGQYIRIGGGAGVGRIQTLDGQWWILTGNEVNARQFGATGGGSVDDAPFVRSAVAFVIAAGGGELAFTRGSYLFNSTVASPVPATEACCVLVQGATNGIKITGDGSATIITGPAAAFSEQWIFTGCTNLEVCGLVIQGNRTGLTPGQENVGIVLNNLVKFDVHHNVFTTGFGAAEGAAIAGDWLVNGFIRNNIMDGVSLGMDLSFMLGVTVSGNILTGAGIGGLVGDRGISVIYDLPLAGNNQTGVSFTDTDHCIITGNTCTNFNAGCYLSTGLDWLVAGNDFYKNPGVSGSGVAGVGLYLDYRTDAFSSVGHPIHNVRVVGNYLSQNGTAANGYGILIGCSAISNSDRIQFIEITGGNSFRDNNSTAILATDSTHCSAISVVGNMFSGASQTVGVDNSILVNLITVALPSNAMMANNLGANPLGYVAPPALPTLTGSTHAVQNTYAVPMDVFIPTQAAAYTIVVETPTLPEGMGSTAANGQAMTISLNSGESVYFSAGTIPGSWFWKGR